MTRTAAARPGEAGTGFAVGAFLAWFAITAGWWALAFLRLPAPPEWLLRTREICFGVAPDGLPEPWGWMLLILAPLSMLTFLLLFWRAELAAGFARLARRPAGWLLLAPLAVVALTGAGGVAARLAASSATPAALAADEPLPAGYPIGTLPAPPLPLVDQHGAPFDLGQLRGRPVFLTFVFGHCPVVCPTLTSTIRRASLAYPGPPPPTVVVTLDPWRDTPGALPGLMTKWGIADLPGARALSGPVDDVLAAIAPWEVGFSRDEKTGDIGHAAMVVVLDGEGRIAYRFLYPPARWLVEAAQRLERAPA